MTAAAATAQETSSSISRCTYDVFLSFRGEDTRTNFTDHLYEALKKAGIHTFLDDDGIERGEDIQTELEKAIEESKISIIVFSTDYASSRWCLDELVMIMELRKAGLIVIPVFYHVDPSQVRKQTGSFAEAFARHEKRFKEEMDKVERWRAALREVADLAGMPLNNRHESQFIQDIVREIWKKLDRPVLNVDPDLVGINSRVKDINLWLQDGSNDVSIATIFGIGGIGKTTIAKTVYNLNLGTFQGSSFLENVKDNSKETEGLVRLQRQLLSDLLKEKMNKVSGVDEGFRKIKKAICCKKVLIVFDDVDKLDQLDKIIGRRNWLSPGSKIIITTRHECLDKDREVCRKFKVNALDDNESLQLLSLHAFGQGHPTEGYMECSKKVVHQCGGLPLALKVLGSALSGKNINVWESELQKLEEYPKSEIQNVLKISYDSLQDDHDKDLFLDIACFFIGEDKDYTIAILDGCNFYTIVGIQTLIDRHLLTIDEKNKLMMHQLLRDMGREIIRQESPKYPEKRSRLWHHKDVSSVLKNETGTEIVEGLTFDLHRLMEDEQDGDYHDKSTIGNCLKQHLLGFFSYLLRFFSCLLGFFFWQPMKIVSKNSFSLSNEIDFETKTFVKMKNLKLLQLNYVKLRGDYEYFSKNLIWLRWHGFHLESIPTNFDLKKLVALDMRYSSLKHVWKGTRFLADLKFLDLSHSQCLVRTPDFSGLPSLERLMLEDCINLVEVNESIGNLDRLVLLDLYGCKSLRKLPREIGMLKSLEILILSGCSNLDELPEEMRKMESLRVLHANGIFKNQLHATTRYTWYSIFCSWFPLTRTPHSLSFSLAFLPHCVVCLNLKNCNLSDDAISHGFASLFSLQYLDLSGNPFCSLPKSIKGLTMLRYLHLIYCEELQSIPEVPNCLKHALMCSIKIIKTPGLWILGCKKLVEIEGLFKLEPLENADVTVLKSLGLSNLEHLRSIEVDIYSFLYQLPKRTPLQVLHECDVLSTFLPGSEIPSCFSLQRMGCSISFDVPPLVGCKIRGLNLCILYEFKEMSSALYDHCAMIRNKTKHVRWTYAPICYAAPICYYEKEEDIEEDMLWLSHWKIGDQLEGGDQIDVSVDFFCVKMCGICLVYEPEDKGSQSNTEEIVRSAFPWYQTVTLTKAGADRYLRCHHSCNLCRCVRKVDYELHDNLTERNPQLELDTCFICEKLESDLRELETFTSIDRLIH